jgi:histidinol-phosphate aminotransferase
MNYFRKNIAAVDGYSPGFQPKTSQSTLVKLNTNENPYPPSPNAVKALGEVTAEKLRRYPDPLGTEFRQAAARVTGLTPEHIMCTNGGDDLLTIVIRSFCDETRPLAYPVPTYSLYPVLADLQNCPTIEVPFGQGYSLPEDLAGPEQWLTIICNPNAPSGSFIEPGKIADFASKIKHPLLIDEAYVDFAPADCIELINKFDNVIILRSMSKGYSLAGIRFGYAVSNPAMIEGLIKVKDSYNVDAISIALAAAAIEDQNYFKDNIARINHQRQDLTAKLRNLGFEVPDSHTNFVLARYKSSAKGIFEKLAEKDIFVRYWDLPGLADKLRITVGTAEQNSALIEAMSEILTAEQR